MLNPLVYRVLPLSDFPMAIVTLLTDFGLDDAYVGMMKGVILSVNPASTVVDITHHVEAQDITQAAYIIQSSFRYFPAGTVHLIVVDPGVGSDRSIIALKMMGHFFLAPDNGVLTLLMEEAGVDDVIRVENSNYFLKPVSRTFHGRDIFAPVGAHLSLGLDLREFGAPIDHNKLVYLDIQKPFISAKGELVGNIVSIDRFGNLITNVDRKCLETFCESDMDKGLQIQIGDQKISGLSENYDQAGPNHPLAIIGSLGYLEVAVNHGSAQRYFKANKRDVVRVVHTGP